MADLRPEAWMLEEEFTDKTLAALFKRRKEPVTNTLVWVQCYASLVAVLAQQYPTQTPQFMAYLATIVRAHRNFEGLGWVVYDTAYRRQAAARKDLNWAIIDTSLYNTLFTGRARATLRCTHCLSQEHLPERCPLVNGPFSQMLQSAGMPHTVQSTTTIGTYPTPPQQQNQNTPKPQICGLYNSNGGPRCTLRFCRFAHICSECFQDHPRMYCPSRKQPQWRGKRPMTAQFAAKRPKFPL